MKYHKCLFPFQTYRGIDKVLQYLTSHLPSTFQHHFKTMKDCEMLSFLHGVLQVYLEFWNTSDPFEEYVPDFTKPSFSIQQECENIIAEIVSLLKHIRSCQFLLSINTVEKMDELQKLNNDLISFWMTTPKQTSGLLSSDIHSMFHVKHLQFVNNLTSYFQKKFHMYFHSIKIVRNLNLFFFTIFVFQ